MRLFGCTLKENEYWCTISEMCHNHPFLSFILSVSNLQLWAFSNLPELFNTCEIVQRIVYASDSEEFIERVHIQSDFYYELYLDDEAHFIIDIDIQENESEIWWVAEWGRQQCSLALIAADGNVQECWYSSSRSPNNATVSPITATVWLSTRIFQPLLLR